MHVVEVVSELQDFLCATLLHQLFRFNYPILAANLMSENPCFQDQSGKRQEERKLSHPGRDSDFGQRFPESTEPQELVAYNSVWRNGNFEKSWGAPQHSKTSLERRLCRTCMFCMLS